MIVGGTITLSLIISGLELPFELDANIYGILLAVLTYSLFHFFEMKYQTPHAKNFG
jgi:SSS family solute:Na+ symporter